MWMLPDAYDTLTLDKIDAAIATFHDPLTADEVVALAQWWTLRAALVTIANETPDEELGLMTRLGQTQQAFWLVDMRDTEQKQWAGFIAIYQANPACTEAHHRLYAMLTRQPAPNTKTQRDYLQQLVRAELVAGRYELAQTAMRHLAWHLDASFAGEVVIGLLQAQRLEAAHELVWTMIGLTQEAGNWRHVSYLMYYIAQTPYQEFCRVVLARLETAFTRYNRALPAEPSNVDYREAYLARMWLGLTRLRLGQLEAARRWLRECDIVDHKTYHDAFVPACEIGSAQCTQPRIIYTLARSLLRRKLNHAGVICLISRLIQLDQPDLARELLPKIKITDKTLIPLVGVYDQLGDNAAGDALLDKHLPRLLQNEQETAVDDNNEHYAVQLVKSGRLSEAFRLISATTYDNRYRQRIVLARTVFEHAALYKHIPQMIELVEQWRQEQVEQFDHARGWYGKQAYFMIQCACMILHHHPDKAQAWAEQAAVWLPQIEERWRRDGLRLDLARFHTDLNEPETALAWINTIERMGDHPFDLYRLANQMLAHSHFVFVRHSLAQMLARRSRLKWDTLQWALQSSFRFGIEHYERLRQTGKPPKIGSTPNPLLPDHTTLAQEWHMLPPQRLYEHLVMLGNLYTVLHAIDPDLYPRVLHACLDVVAQFAPEWAAQAQIREI
jgi:hypothetical protein